MRPTDEALDLKVSKQSKSANGHLAIWHLAIWLSVFVSLAACHTELCLGQSARGLKGGVPMQLGSILGFNVVGLGP